MQIISNSVTYVNGSTSLAPFRRVFDIGGALRYAGSTEIENGIITRRILPNDPAGVQLLNTGGPWDMIANGPIAKDASVYRAADGKVSSAGSSLIGTAESASAVDGDIISVLYQSSGGDGGGDGGGDVFKVGVPANDQIGIWTGDSTIEGSPGLTFNGTELNLNGTLTTTALVNGRNIATDGSTIDSLAAANSVDVTIAAGLDYATIVGQEITLGQVDLTTDVTGILPAANVAIDPAGDLVGGGSGIALSTTLDQGQYTFSSAVVAAVAPTLSTHLTNKGYVDSLINGLSWKDAARVAELASNITIASPGAIMDGVTMVASDRVLLNAQTAGSENGLWVWNSATTPMTRPADHAAGTDPSGHTVVITEGTSQNTYTQNVDGILIDTGAQVWVLQSGGSITAGDGLIQSGNAFLVLGDVTTGGDIAPVAVSGNGTGLDVTSLDGDHLTISWSPVGYTADATPIEAVDVADLTAHLAGVGNGLNTKTVWRGVWVSPGPYVTNDEVSYNGALYIANDATTVEVPGVSGKWDTKVASGIDMFSTVATKAALLTQGATVGFRGHVTEVTNSKLRYVFSGTDATIASHWTPADLNRETWLTEAEFTAILTNYTDLEDGQIVNKTDGDEKRYRFDSSVPEWIELVAGSGSGGSIVDNLTWSVAGSTGTANLSQLPADPEKVRFIMRNGLTFLGTNSGDGQVQVTGQVCTIDTTDFGFPLTGDRVLAIYEV